MAFLVVGLRIDQTRAYLQITSNISRLINVKEAITKKKEGNT